MDTNDKQNILSVLILFIIGSYFNFLLMLSCLVSFVYIYPLLNDEELLNATTPSEINRQAKKVLVIFFMYVTTIVLVYTIVKNICQLPLS